MKAESICFNYYFFTNGFCLSSSSETQGQIAEARESQNGRNKMATKKNIVCLSWVVSPFWIVVI